MQDNQIPVAPIILILFAIVGVVLLAGMIAFFIFLATRAVKRRSYDPTRGQQMQQAAGQIGFTFQPEAELSALPFFSGFELFEGDKWKFENLMTGKINRHDAVIFDLAYRNVGSRGTGSTTSRQTIYAVISRDLDLPEFYVRPEGVIEKVLNAVSRVDIDFAERPAFSQNFLLYGKNETAIRGLFTLPKLDFFEKNPNLCVFGGGNYLFLYHARNTTPPMQVPQNLNFLAFLHDLFRQ